LESIIGKPELLEDLIIFLEQAFARLAAECGTAD
jgi:hypothetical protein